MSIYSSWLVQDEHANHELECDRHIQVSSEEAEAHGSYGVSGEKYFLYDVHQICTCGQRGPLVYQGSHVNPSEDHQRGGNVEVAIIPNHCHPSVRGTRSDQGPKVEFLRLSVDEDPATYRGNIPGSATVVLDRERAEELRDTLTAWLEAEERY